MTARHRTLAAAAFVVVALPAVAGAQVPSECELRIGSFALGGSLSVPGAGAYVEPSGGAGGGSEALTSFGRGLSAELSVPIMPGWGGRLDYTRGHLAVERRTYTPDLRAVERRTKIGEVGLRHVNAAVVHTLSPPGRLCGYAGGGIGLYEFTYAGQRARNRGLFALAGVEFPVGERSGLALEMQLHAAHNDYEGALRAETVFLLKPAVLFRVRF